MVGWHHRLHGHEFEQALGDGEGQGSLACCSPWGCKESDMTEQLNNNNNNNNTCYQTSVRFLLLLYLVLHRSLSHKPRRGEGKSFFLLYVSSRGYLMSPRFLYVDAVSCEELLVLAVLHKLLN